MSLVLFGNLSREWEASGRSEALLLDNEYRLVALRCWVHRPDVLPAMFAPRIRAWAEASFAAQARRDPDWYEAMLATRTLCDRCGESYRVENLSICTLCVRTYCPHCADEWRTGGPSTPVHFCGGDLVG